mgnify:CR=1 FL=1
MVSYDMRRITDIEKFSLCFVYAEYFQSGSAIPGIDALHVGVLLKNFVQFFVMNVLDFAAEGNRDVPLRCIINIKVKIIFFSPAMYDTFELLHCKNSSDNSMYILILT